MFENRRRTDVRGDSGDPARPFFRVNRRFWAAIAVGLACIRVGWAQCQYEVTAIIQAPPCPFVGPPNTVPAGMSEDGKVAGWYRMCGVSFNEAFVWVPNPDSEGGTFTTLPRPDGVLSATASDVNSAGFVIGSHMFEAGGTRGFIFNPGTEEFTYLEPADPSATHGTLSTVNAINDSNVVVGSRRIPPAVPPVLNAVIWMPYGEDGDGEEVVIDLGVGDGPSSVAEDGNHEMDAAGWSGTLPHSTNARAILWIEGEPIDLGVLPEAVQSVAVSVNNVLESVGTSSEAPTIMPHGFHWYEGTMAQLLPPVPFVRFFPNYITDGQQIAGILRTSINHAGLWQHGDFHELQQLVVNPPTPFYLSSAVGVDANGQILANGGGRGYLLTPVNVPAGDLNFDCTVGVADLLLLLSEWGNADSFADLDGNGTVGVADLLILLANWGS